MFEGEISVGMETVSPGKNSLCIIFTKDSSCTMRFLRTTY